MEVKKLPKNELIHDFSGKKTTSKIDATQKPKKQPNPLIFVVIITLILGLGTGFIAAQTSGSITRGPISLGDPSDTAEIKKGKTFGVSDTKTFPDTVGGIVREGGIDGEGAFHLERPGGESQNVYMTSSAVDLSLFIGKKVKVWGQTQTAQTAGWLMDVGKVEVL